MFITIEGVEGAGKSTLRARLSDFATTLGREVVITREPGATALGQTIRNLLLDSSSGAIDNLAELMLFCADRAQHLAEVVNPALKRGALVFCDRYTHSTLAYQGYGRGLDIAKLMTLNDFITANVKPDLVLLLDLDPKIGLDRARDRSRRASGTFNVTEIKKAMAGETTWTRFEEQALEFHKKVRAGFLELAKDPANNFAIIDASKDAETVAQSAIAHISKLLDVAR